MFATARDGVENKKASESCLGNFHFLRHNCYQILMCSESWESKQATVKIWKGKLSNWPLECSTQRCHLGGPRCPLSPMIRQSKRLVFRWDHETLPIFNAKNQRMFRRMTNSLLTSGVSRGTILCSSQYPITERTQPWVGNQLLVLRGVETNSRRSFVSCWQAKRSLCITAIHFKFDNHLLFTSSSPSRHTNPVAIGFSVTEAKRRSWLSKIFRRWAIGRWTIVGIFWYVSSPFVDIELYMHVKSYK